MKLLYYTYVSKPDSIIRPNTAIEVVDTAFLYNHALIWHVVVEDTNTNIIYTIDMLNTNVKNLFYQNVQMFKDLIASTDFDQAITYAIPDSEYIKRVRFGNRFRHLGDTVIYKDISDTEDLSVMLVDDVGYTAKDIETNSLFVVNGLVHYSNYDVTNRQIVISNAKETISRVVYDYVGRVDFPRNIEKYTVSEDDVFLTSGASDALTGFDIQVPTSLEKPAVIILGMLFTYQDIGFSQSGNLLTISFGSLDIGKIISGVSRFIDLTTVVGSDIPLSSLSTIAKWKAIMNHPLSFVVDFNENKFYISSLENRYTNIVNNIRSRNGAGIVRTGQYMLPEDRLVNGGPLNRAYRLPDRNYNPIILKDAAGEPIEYTYDDGIKESIFAYFEVK